MRNHNDITHSLIALLIENFILVGGTRREHLTELYCYLGVKGFTNKIQQSCITHLLPMATRTDKGILLAEEMLAYLR